MKKRVNVDYAMDFIKEMTEHLQAMSSSIDDPQLKRIINSYYNQYILIENEYFLDKTDKSSNE
jgi:hypothetical protein